jgi:diaminopimelate epimerase
MRESNKKKISLGTKSGILKATLDNKNLITINIGRPNFKWNTIPLLKDINNRNLKIKINSNDGKEIIGGFSLNVGNPHVIFFVNDFNQFNLKEIGPEIENHKYFPEKCNVTLACVENKKYLKIKVWERGAGLTKACGTAACAAAVAGAELKLTNRCVDIKFQQGVLNIDWKMDNNIYMKGKVSEIKKIIVNI